MKSIGVFDLQPLEGSLDGVDEESPEGIIDPEHA
jgi:hypothetical protein